MFPQMHSMNDPNQSYVGHYGPIALQGAPPPPPPPIFPLQNTPLSNHIIPNCCYYGSRFYVFKVRAPWVQHSSHSLDCGLLLTHHPPLPLSPLCISMCTVHVYAILSMVGDTLQASSPNHDQRLGLGHRQTQW